VPLSLKASILRPGLHIFHKSLLIGLENPNMVEQSVKLVTSSRQQLFYSVDRGVVIDDVL
jgi:hypothetical protein